METPIDKQALFDEYVQIIRTKTAHLDQDEFAVYAYQNLFTFYRGIEEAKNRDTAETWGIRMSALMRVIEHREMESRVEQTVQDYRWTLIYIAKDKRYQLTETQLVQEEWVVSRTVWPHLSEALNYIRQTNAQRKRPITH